MRSSTHAADVNSAPTSAEAKNAKLSAASRSALAGSSRQPGSLSVSCSHSLSFVAWVAGSLGTRDTSDCSATSSTNRVRLSAAQEKTFSMGGGGGIRGSCDLRTEDVRRGEAEGDVMEERRGDAGGVLWVERDSIVVE
jgi:hypothetical protein